MSKISLVLDNEAEIIKREKCDWSFANPEGFIILSEDFLVDDPGALSLKMEDLVSGVYSRWESKYNGVAGADPSSSINIDKLNGWGYTIHEDHPFVIFAEKQIGNSDLSIVSVGLFLSRENEVKSQEWEQHERGILERLKRKVNPNIPAPEDGSCPKYSTGNGWNVFHSYRRLAYNDFGRLSSARLEDMFEEAKSHVPSDRKVVDAPFPDDEYRGDTPVDFSTVAMQVSGYRVMIGVKYRPDKWYDFCLTIFTNFRDTDRPDIS